MAAQAWQLEQFERQMEKALERARIVLEEARRPCFASGVHHQYQDKFALANSMTNAALASHANCLALLGVSAEQLTQMCDWGKASAVSLRFRADESCTFLREETRDVEDPTKKVVEGRLGGLTANFSSKTVTTVTEYFWNFEVSYELMAVRGVGEKPDDIISIQKRTGQVELKTTTKQSPHPAKTVPAKLCEVNVTWMIKLLNMESGHAVPKFYIDRSHKDCHTPRRNREMIQGNSFMGDLSHWITEVTKYMTKLLNIQPDPSTRLDLQALQDDTMFDPIAPYFVDTEQQSIQPIEADDVGEKAPEGLLACLTKVIGLGDNILDVKDLNALLSEEARMLKEKEEALRKAFPSSGAVATAAEAILCVVLRHCAHVCQRWMHAVDYIESMLRKQLVAAIGKEVTPSDFAEYMRFHNRRLFAEEYAPIPFCFAVRRSERHSPEGTLSIEEEAHGGDSTVPTPIVTVVSRSSREHYMQFPLSASTNISFGGDKYLHAWLAHSFSGDSGSSLKLVSRTRQFSSMIVLVGRISSAKTFDPTYAAIVRNKDELKIPLDLSTIPTPKEFKDAIESLSPEQQAFAKAFRSMQLESTLFGILVIQIKPQLEKVLKMPDDSLTKEIKLTQELMDLFITYQIPSDLLAFDENNNVHDDHVIVGSGPVEKVAAVKRHVAAMYEMINKSKDEEIQSRVMEETYAHPHGVPIIDQSLSIDLLDMQECMSLSAALPCAAEAAPPVAARSLKKSMSVKKKSGGLVRTAMSSVSAAVSTLSSKAMAESAKSAPNTIEAPKMERSPSQQQQPQHNVTDDGETGGQLATGRDYTQVPKEMDARFETLDVDGQVRPTIINPGSSWTKHSQKALLAKPEMAVLDSDAQKKEKDAAFDLLDALTKSGAIPVEHASLHVVVAASHCFDKSVLETLVQDNVNPIDKVERSTLIMATTVHQQPTDVLIKDAQIPRVQDASPMLFAEALA